MNKQNLYHVTAETDTHTIQCCVVAETNEDVIKIVSDYTESAGLGKLDVTKIAIFLGTSDKIYAFNITKKGICD